MVVEGAPVRVGRRFALRTTEKSVVFLYLNSPQLPSTEGAVGAVDNDTKLTIKIKPFSIVNPRLGRSKEFKESRNEKRSVLCTRASQ